MQQIKSNAKRKGLPCGIPLLMFLFVLFTDNNYTKRVDIAISPERGGYTLLLPNCEHLFDKYYQGNPIQTIRRRS